jgi:hypothetical protein
VVGRQVRALAREADREAQLEEAQPVRGRHRPQRLRALAVEGRVVVQEHLQQPRPVLLVHGVQSQLDAVGEELLELRLDGVGDAAQTADGLALAGRLRGQARGAAGADDRLGLHALDLVGGALDEAHLLLRRREVLARRQARVETPQPPPGAQVLLVVARTQRTRVLDGELQ